MTSKEFADQVTALPAGLIAAGIQPGDRVALLSATRFEWLLADFAIWTAGAVTVPIYETSSLEQVRWILSDSGTVAMFAENERLAALAERAGVESVRQAGGFDSGAVDELNLAGKDVPARPHHRAPQWRDRGVPRHHRVHVGHDWAAERLHAQPRHPGR